MTKKYKTSYHVVIKGRVQGVWFRDWTIREATQNKLSGWVRNQPDGSVEAVISGITNNADQMLEAFKIGPKMARVTSVDATPCEPPDNPDFLRI